MPGARNVFTSLFQCFRFHTFGAGTESRRMYDLQLVIGIDKRRAILEQKGLFVLVDPKDSWVHALLQVKIWSSLWEAWK